MHDYLHPSRLEDRVALRTIRSKVLEACPMPDIKALNLQRVEQFIASQGFWVADYIFFSSHQIPQVTKLLEGTGLEKSFVNFANNPSELGTYLRELDLAIVKQDDALGEKNGAVYTESLVIHELAHATDARNAFDRAGVRRIDDPGRNDPFLVKFIEEGFAEREAGKYVARYISTADGEVANIIRRRGYSVDDTWTYPDPIHNMWLPIPFRYLYFTPDSDKTIPDKEMINQWTLPAIALDLLCKKYPDLDELLTQARGSQEKRHQLAKLFDTIETGLLHFVDNYDRLKVSATEEFQYYLKFFSHITDITCGGINNTIRASGNPLVGNWKKAIAAKPFKEEIYKFHNTFPS